MLRSKAIMAVLLAVSTLPLQAQDKQQTSVIVKLRNVDANQARNLMIHLSVAVTSDPQLQVLVIRGDPEQVAKAEQIAKQLDQEAASVPRVTTSSSNVEVTFYFIEGASQMPPNARNVPEVEPVLRQLKTVFPFGAYFVLDSVQTRARAGRRVQMSGLLPQFGTQELGGYLSTYQLQYTPNDLGGAKGTRIVHLNDLRFNVRVPVSTGPPTATQFQYQDSGINSDLDVREGQKVVVGKANVLGNDTALFLVVSARVVE